MKRRYSQLLSLLCIVMVVAPLRTAAATPQIDLTHLALDVGDLPSGAVVLTTRIATTAAAVNAEGVLGSQTTQGTDYQRLGFTGSLVERVNLPRVEGKQHQLLFLVTAFPSAEAATHAYADDNNSLGDTCTSSPDLKLTVPTQTCGYSSSTPNEETGMYVVGVSGPLEFTLVSFAAGVSSSLRTMVRSEVSLTAARLVTRIVALVRATRRGPVATPTVSPAPAPQPHRTATPGSSATNSPLPTGTPSPQTSAPASPTQRGGSVSLPIIDAETALHGVPLWGPVSGPDGRFYMATDNGALLIIGSDHVRTTVRMPDGHPCVGFALGDDGTLYLASQGSQISALAMPSRQIMWSVMLEGDIVGSPILINGTVDVLTADGVLHSLFALDGTVRHSFHVDTVETSLSNGPRADSQRTTAYFMDDHGIVHAIAHDREVWRLDVAWASAHKLGVELIPDGATTVSRGNNLLTLPSGDIIVTLPNRHIIAAVSSGGHLRWARNLDTSGYVLPPTVQSNGTFLVSAANGPVGGSLFLLNPNGSIAWTSADPEIYNLSTPIQIDSQGYLYMVRADMAIVAAFARDGGRKWVLPLPRGSGDEVISNLVVAQDNTLLVATSAHLFSIGGEALFTLPMAIMAHPSVQNRLLWTWRWLVQRQPQSFLGIVYHYVGKEPVGDSQQRLAGSASSFASTGHCGQTYYLRIQAVGPGFSATYYAPPDGITIRC